MDVEVATLTSHDCRTLALKTVFRTVSSQKFMPNVILLLGICTPDLNFYAYFFKFVLQKLLV